MSVTNFHLCVTIRWNLCTRLWSNITTKRLWCSQRNAKDNSPKKCLLKYHWTWLRYSCNCTTISSCCAIAEAYYREMDPSICPLPVFNICPGSGEIHLGIQGGIFPNQLSESGAQDPLKVNGFVLMSLRHLKIPLTVTRVTVKMGLVLPLFAVWPNHRANSILQGFASVTEVRTEEYWQRRGGGSLHGLCLHFT